MDLYISSLLLGAVGLGAMALSGLGSRTHSGGPAHGHAGHGLAGHGHVGHGHTGHGHSHAGDAQAAHGHDAAATTHASHGVTSRTFWAITSPRFLFSLFLGFGTTGELFRPILGGPFLLAAAVAGAVVFERLIVSPLWNFTMRFASTPSSNLESAVSDEATAVTSFDANGQGIVSVEMDGQVVQILATLQADDHLLGGAPIRAGQRVRIEEVNAEKNTCTVSLL